MKRTIVFLCTAQQLANGFILTQTPRAPPAVVVPLQAVSIEHDDTISLDLPPRENLTKLEQEFRDKLSIFARYTDDQIASIPNVRLRALYEGVAASAHDPAVYRAFEVLFEDLHPLRIAGRMIFGKLAEDMDEHYERRIELMKLTGLSKEEVDASRTTFNNVFGHNHHKFSRAELEAVVTAVNEALGEDLDLPKGKVSQEIVLVSLSKKTEEPSAVLQSIHPPRDIHKLDSKKSKFEDRYNEMVHDFSQWENSIPSGEGRRLDVLRGCFVGAKNEKVVKALKIIYVDYSALRFA
eukprot:CAMPEP_0119008578 /NCGR_PEP_ID=MMETSP1176-20130426/3799_1 /TAXON_ID=265551 /ORGANISM="Synedropsis recta cf, Strain CCMP1620" /LENGTH=293 /DNA_ID=CAMNT_0006960937 /DNA_START=64 /DNA_END=942 /DNA_ORIENTATION=-